MILTEYHKIFYPNGKGFKIIPTETLEQLEPLGLAVWYIVVNKKNDNEEVVRWLKNKFDISPKMLNIQKNII